MFILCDYQSPACGLVKYDGEICESTRADRSVALTREHFKIVSWGQTIKLVKRFLSESESGDKEIWIMTQNNVPE